jgi:4-hydroxy-tetrahydrodipicolinate reductase
VRLALCGTGRMGRLIGTVAEERGAVVVLRLDSSSNADGAGLVAASLRDVEVVIDFSRADAVLPNLRRAAEHGKDVVIGTTGWDRDPAARTEAARIARVGGVGVIASPNFSLGMHLFRRVVQEAARLAAAHLDLDVWIEEAHHRGKADHPSGTALQLAEDVRARLPRKDALRTELPEGPVAPSDLVVVSSRGGYRPGLHRVVIDFPEESIELIHEARSRRAFALGALAAALWVRGRKGFFTLDDMLETTT